METKFTNFPLCNGDVLTVYSDGRITYCISTDWEIFKFQNFQEFMMWHEKCYGWQYKKEK